MPVLATTNPTMADLAKNLDPSGKLAEIVEVMNQTNEILEYMPWIEGNLPTGHRDTVRTGLPAPTWRKLYGGVQPGKSTEIQVTENCGMLEAYSEVDKALAELSSDVAGFRWSRDKAQMEGMSQELAQTIFYGNEGNDSSEFTGLAPRYNTRLATTAATGDNVIHGGGAGSDNMSVWLMVLGDGKVHGIYPKGTKAGLDMRDLGECTIENVDGSNGRMQAYRTHFRWNCGMRVADWRYVVRICNISKAALTKDAATGADLVDLMAQAMELPPSLNGGKPVFVVNRTVRSFLRRQMKNSKNVQLSLREAAGKQVLMFDEVPVIRCDALLETEAVVPNT
jgi:hypothetical protein